jgi:hypothetical protein
MPVGEIGFLQTPHWIIPHSLIFPTRLNTLHFVSFSRLVGLTIFAVGSRIGSLGKIGPFDPFLKKSAGSVILAVVNPPSEKKNLHAIYGYSGTFSATDSISSFANLLQTYLQQPCASRVTIIAQKCGEQYIPCNSSP